MKTVYYFTPNKRLGDPDARAFLTAAGITDTSQRKAVQDLVTALKAVGFWNKMLGLYPMVGGTAQTHQYNLKDPRDENNAFRLTFMGSMTHSPTGVQFNGNGFANTHLSPFVRMAQNDSHVSYYSRTNIGGNVEIEMGSQNGGQQEATFLIYNINGGSFVSLNNADINVATSAYTPSTGLLVLTRKDAGALYSQHKKVSRQHNNPSSTPPIPDIYLGARNFAGGADYLSTKECAFASIGSGFTLEEMVVYQDIVDAYQAALGRAV